MITNRSTQGIAPGKTVLLIGSGGREHALGWKLSLSTKVSRLIVAPGNDGFPADWERWPLPKFDTGNFEALAKRAREAQVHLAVIGPDNALASGIVDVFERHGILCFGPSSQAARLESSKIFSKTVMSEARVPTAEFFSASTLGEAREILRSLPWPQGSGWVIKADGLALGKGVHVCTSSEQAEKSAEALFSVSGKILIEEKLSGQEVSWLAFCDGSRCALLEPARDHKTLRDGGLGPNTGGMGAFSPVPEVPDNWYARVREEVFMPVLHEMKRLGTPFKGVLYAGLMCDFKADKFSVLEFNARFGDPEAQVLLSRMDGELFDWCEAVARGDLSAWPERVPFKKESSVVVVAAARGYPEQPEKYHRISGSFESAPSFFLAGVSKAGDGGFVTSGGRVFGAMGSGLTLKDARAQAYKRMNQVLFEGMQFRKDIGDYVG
jgi:phosphoribosylamine--glycine ligase